MPELPEVENIRRSLCPNLINKTFELLPDYHKDVFLNPFNHPTQNLLLTDLERRGKYLIFRFDNDLLMIAHLRMTGRFTYVTNMDEEKLKHTHVIFSLKDIHGNLSSLRYSDPRRFGRILLIGTEELGNYQIGLNELGPEPLTDDFNDEYLFTTAQKHPKMNIKGFLLNQSIVAGLGNIYVDEILFASKVSPMSNAASISREKFKAICENSKNILSISIQNHGTTFRDYRDGNGNSGNFQNKLYVYGLSGQPCRICATKLQTAKIAGRSTVFCPKCQNSL